MDIGLGMWLRGWWWYKICGAVFCSDGWWWGRGIDGRGAVWGHGNWTRQCVGGGVRKVGTWAIKVDQLGGLNLKGP